uniref:Uncharacterized protein n=1 Tax=Lactuca sativa TaxID=4236 RepID=A0A9R1VP45_LACSA|nr:hypothetical protein LSAT_V11C400176310 [Lactuca sativa]
MQLERSGGATKCAIKLREYDISYKSRVSIMDQALANFLTEVPQDEKMDFYIVKEPQVEIISTKSMSHEQCVLYTNVTYALCFDFECSNNKVEYEALIACLKLAVGIDVSKVKVGALSKLVWLVFNHLAKKVLVDILPRKSIEGDEQEQIVTSQKFNKFKTFQNNPFTN